MSTLFGEPLAIVLIVVGLIFLVAAWFLHWLLIILGIILIVVGLYLVFVAGVGTL